ncbi:ATP-binding protein [Streptomyces sp. TRM66268-LWL]|uniref:ATP-binding protein n=1 Tax=Streptomyces polyasparticus TaxID=2767826 RepID=A0ABR7SRE4_9ACTN|nr:ATP-binding protein [Streptomyces polyasparticus]MBC9717101.1 ATP-binding protein [Streptomyces polyasparticus]
MPVPPQAPATVLADIEWRLPRHARSAGRARTLLREQAGSWHLPDALSETAELLLSELATNAYRHAKVPGREICVRATLTTDRLRISVTDASSTPPVLRNPATDEECGRGLALLSVLSDAWGAELRACGIGKTVWFELNREPQP